MAENKTRTKMRKNRASIDDTYAGPEPAFQPGETALGISNRDILWSRAAGWYNYFLKPKDYVKDVLRFATEVYGYDKSKIKPLSKLKDWELTLELGKVAKIHYRGYEYTKEELERFKCIMDDLYAKALTVVEEEKDEDQTNSKPKVSVQDRVKAKVQETICVDWDNIVDGWSDGNFKQEIDVFKLFKQYDLKGPAINIFKDIIEREGYNAIKDAYDKKCDQAVEGYNHIKRSDQKKMIKLMETIFEDLDKLKIANKATRVPRAKTPKRSDAQVKNLKYKLEDIDAKITSINPVMIPGKQVLWLYNTKTRKLTQLESDSPKGFEVSGTTVKNICDKTSRGTTLRKPADILPLVLSKTIKQIDKKVWGTITTKVSVPNGRINADCILLRVL